MSDMTLCSSLHCPVKGDCFRATAKPNPVRQSYYNFEYTCYEDNGFVDFIKCYRSTATASKYQSWSNFEYTCNENSGYTDFIPTKMED